MRFAVRPLRRRGCRLAWRDVDNGPVYFGELRTRTMREGTSSSYRVATLADPNSNVASHLLPDLYEPLMVAIGVRVLHLRGYERWEGEDGPYGVLQEWFCEQV